MKAKYLIFIGSLVFLTGLGFVLITQNIIVPKNQGQISLRKGQIYLEQETQASLQKAIDEFANVIGNSPNSNEHYQALFYLAECYEKLGSADLALTKYRHLMHLPLNDKLKARTRFRLAKIQISMSYADEGKSRLYTLLSSTEDNQLRSEIYTEIAAYEWKAGNHAKARNHYEIALREDSSNKKAQVQLARLLNQSGKDGEGLSQYNYYLAYEGGIDGQKKDVLAQYRKDAYGQGMRFFYQKQYWKALEQFNQVIAKFRGTQDGEMAQYFAGNSYFFLKRYKQATQAFEKVLQHQPASKDEAAMIKLGETYFKMSDNVKAAATFARYQREYPRGKYQKIAEEWLREIQQGDSLGSDDKKNPYHDSLTDKNQKIEPKIEDYEKQHSTHEIIEPILNDSKILTP